MWKKYIKSIVFLLTFVFFLGCSFNSIRDTKKAKGIDGVWSECKRQNNIFTCTTLNFHQQAVIFEFDSYLYRDLSTLLLSAKMKGTYKIGNQVKTVSGEHAFEIDYNFSSFVMTPKDPYLTAEFNIKNACGYSDWVFSTPKEIINRSCGEFEHPIPIDGKIFDIFMIDNTATPKRLFFGMGENKDLLNLGKRPKELDKKSHIIRKDSSK